MLQTENRQNKVLTVMFLSFIPLLLVKLFLVRDLKAIADIYILNGNFNDEMLYFKQIEGIIVNGRPFGNFGYYESTSQIGGLGPWSPMLLWPYAIIGKVCGWNYLSPVLYNIVFMMIAFGIMGWLVGNSERWRYIAISFSIFMMDNVVRYWISGLIEPLLYSLVIVLVALVYYNSLCFLQVLFGQSCKIFLDIVACPNWTKLQSGGQSCLD